MEGSGKAAESGSVMCAVALEARRAVATLQGLANRFASSKQWGASEGAGRDRKR